jgi:hypothetical protein
MPSIPGSNNVIPGVYSEVVTQSNAISIPGGSRVAAIIGEGSPEEVIVSQAVGGGKDGFNSSYTSTSGSDGRHFLLSRYPIVSNRTTLFKNGIPLTGLESLIDSSSFNNKYDYRIDITTGRIELQKAHLVDQGGSFYVPLTTNVGDGYLTALTLLDANAPPETWTIRCVSVQRSSLNQPVGKTARFLAYGSVSGTKLDANGNPIVWTANGNVVSNGVLSFAIYERQVGGTSVTPFREGDAFTIIVSSGVLVLNDSLVVVYIPVSNLNDPVLLQGMQPVSDRHGYASLDNNLSLGCQLAFSNAAPVIMTVQAAPAMPRRQSYILTESFDALSENDDDFIFPLPVGVTPDYNSSIHFFVVNNATNVETQLLPNKLDYYLLDTSGQPTTHQFVSDDTPAPGGWSYYYTVKQSFEALATGFDGYIARDPGFNNKGVFSSSINFDSSYVNKALKIIDTVNSSNLGLFRVTSVSNSKLYVVADGTVMDPTSGTYYNPTYLSDFANETSVSFEVVNIATGLPLDGYSGTDGVLTTVGASTGQATLTSATVDFSGVTNIATNYRLQVNGSSLGNDGLYDISSPVSFGVTLTKAIVTEHNMRYELLDPADLSNYVAINKNVVPNGYGLRVTLIDTKDASFYDAGWVNALESLEKVECDIIVPLPKQTISVIFQNALAHCKAMSNIRNRKERVLFMGAISGLTPDNVIGLEPAAVEDIGILEGIQGDNVTEVLAGNIEDLANYSVPDAFGNTYRCVYFYPDQIVVQAGTQNAIVDGFYLAAAAAGYESADLRIENPLTNKVLSGFSILRNKLFTTTVLEQLTQAGITVLQPVSGGGRVIWGMTTSQSGYPEEQEISIVFIRDRVAKTLRAGFAGFPGTVETETTQSDLSTRATLILGALISSGVITNFANLVVKRNEADPRQWDISVKVQPPYPVNWIYIKIAIGII